MLLLIEDKYRVMLRVLYLNERQRAAIRGERGLEDRFGAGDFGYQENGTRLNPRGGVGPGPQSHRALY
jgi:hypothetical protein